MSIKRVRNDERGGILALSAFMVALFLVLTALVVDVGNWYTHKRQLQNKADSGALAAGYEYLSQLDDCRTPALSGAAAAAIGDVAKRYAGTGDGAITGLKYNQTINSTTNLTVRVNASSPTASDWSDGANPCEKHTAGDSYSPSNAIWTDVKVQETNLGTLFGGFGLNLLSATAQARVEMKQIIGVSKRGIPLVTETGQTIECVWAKFVRADNGGSTGFTVTPSNPIPLTGGPYTWTGSVANLRFTQGHVDVAIQYWAGSKNGSAPCVYDEAGNQRPLPHKVADDMAPVAIDWINVYDTGAAPGTDSPPKLRRFALTSNTCGGPGFLHTTSTLATEECRVGFQADIDTGPNQVRGTITVNPHQTGVDPVTVDFDNTSGGGVKTVNGTIRVYPNEVSGSTTVSQDFTQVGPTWFSVSWHQTTGRVANGSKGLCPGGADCSQTFQGDQVSGVSDFVQQMTYTDDPLGSPPLVSTSKSPATNSYPALGQTGAFTLSFTHTGIDKAAIVLLRDSVQSNDKRTRAIWCGGHSGGAKEIEEAFKDGCPVPLKLNTRQDSCSTPPGGWPEEPSRTPLDCIQLEQGNKTGPVRDGIEVRFKCTDNNWDPGGKLPLDDDPRWAYIVLTGFGRIIPAPNNGFLPIEGLVRIYATGWGGKNFAGPPCAANDPPPRGWDDKGAQLWGHMVDIVTLADDVIVGEPGCKLEAAILTCKPALVR